MVSCTSCKKNATKKRIIYDGICNDCSISDKTNEIVSNIGVDVEDNVKDLKIRDLIKIFHGILLPLLDDFNSRQAKVENALTNHASKIKVLEANYELLKKELQEMTSLKDDLQALIDDKPKIGKVINEQQKCLERLHRAEIKNNVFITGIPNKLNLNDNSETDDNNVIIKSLFNTVANDVSEENYKIIKTFEGQPGNSRHSALVKFTDPRLKDRIMERCKSLKDLDNENPFKLVYIKHEQPPLTHRENNRLYGKFKKLREDFKNDTTVNIRLYKGKLYKNEEIVDEFDLRNQNF